MIELYSYIIENIYQFLGVVFSIIYVLFSIRQNILCWPSLIFAAILNMFAYHLIDLPLQVFMQLFFIGTAIYGWYNWHKGGNNEPIKITSWSNKNHLTWICLGGTGTLILTIILKQFSAFEILHSNYPFLDSLMFIFNIIPMYMTGKKILESWLYFIFIDIISGLFYLITGEFFFSFLFFCYIGFATYGYITWKKNSIC